MNLMRNKFAQVMPAMLVGSLILFGCQPNSMPDNQTSETQGEPTQQTQQKHLAITAIVEHPSLDDIRNGIVDGLASLGYKDGQNLTVNFHSAQGSMATAGQIAKQFVADNPDAIVAITTPSAQSLAAATTSIPLIYTAVSDPVAAKLIDNNNKPTQENITGLSSQLPIEPQIELFSKIKPEAKRIGFVYSPGEANSVAVMNQLKQQLPKYGMSLVEMPANRSSDVADATKALAGKVDLIYTSLDNGVASAMEAMVQVANEMQVPVITSDEFSVRRGATAALGVNDYDFGVTTAQMVAQILDGKKPAQISPQMMNELTFFYSPKHAQTQGLTLDLSALGQGINVDDTPAKQNLAQK